MITEFKNEPLVDFSKKENYDAMLKALDLVSSQLGKEYDLVIDGKKIKGDGTFNSFNPSKKEQVVGTFQKATPEIAKEVVEIAYERFQSWRFVPPEERANYLFKAAEVVRRRRLELAAWMIYEVGKSWVEADADVAEAIDFLEFYGREMLRLSQPQPLTKIPTENNELHYIPLGVGIVIPPWNFPLAILVGMTSASFVSGNTVVLKPSSDSPTIAYKFFEVLEEIGLPNGVVNFFTGKGASIGDILVAHPKTRFIAFTGSKEIGLKINELASKTQEGQIWIKRVIAEMGGKDSIVVDEECDLDSAAEGIVISAFGYQGQKCSACSRAIIVEKVYDKLIEKIVEKTKKLKMGDVTDYNNTFGPVINKGAMESILYYIEEGKKEGKLILGGGKDDKVGYFIEPTIIVDVPPKAKIALEEIFGPVLAVIKAKDYDDALQIANNTEYGLTGSIYTTSREKIEKGKKLFHVGNLYINRKCTGALVGVHPFGGFNMSGTDSKAGGRDYLLLFTQAKVISEKV